MKKQEKEYHIIVTQTDKVHNEKKPLELTQWHL